MAREHARLWLNINRDDDFEALPFDAQCLYTRVILTLDDLDYCGVADWRPRKLTRKAPDLTLPRILTAAHHLEAARFCLFDLDTEEVLARSYIRRDELLRNPKMAAAVIKAFGGIASKMLRAAVVDEIRRVRDEHPEFSSWSNAHTGAELSKIMGRDGGADVPYVPQISMPITNDITNGQTVHITNRITNRITNPIRSESPIGFGPDRCSDYQSDHQSDSVPIPSTYTSTSTPAPLEGLRNGGTSPDGDGQDAIHPPSRFCPNHPTGTAARCLACAAARRHREAFDAQSRAERTAFWAGVRECPDCDDRGLLIADDGDTASRCPRHDWQTQPREVTR